MLNSFSKLFRSLDLFPGLLNDVAAGNDIVCCFTRCGCFLSWLDESLIPLAVAPSLVSTVYYLAYCSYGCLEMVAGVHWLCLGSTWTWTLCWIGKGGWSLADFFSTFSLSLAIWSLAICLWALCVRLLIGNNALISCHQQLCWCW